MTSRNSGSLASPWLDDGGAADGQTASRNVSQLAEVAAPQPSAARPSASPPGVSARQAPIGAAAAATRGGTSGTGYFRGFARGVVESMVVCPRGELDRPQHRVAVKSLERRINCVFFFLGLMWPFTAFLFVRSNAVFFGTRHASCDDLWWTLWLIGFVVLQLVAAVMIYCAPLFFLWTLGALLLEMPHNCPMLRDFFEQALALQGAQCVLFLGATGVALSALPVLCRLRLAVVGAHPLVLDLIAVVDAGQIPLDEECAVCLSHEAEGVDDSRSHWRQLECGHRFHEVCLLRWLEEAHRCPICRSDLHATYSDAGLDVESNAVG